MAQYREPGVYLTVDKTGVANPVTNSRRIPLVVGGGPTVLKGTFAITRASSGQTDTLPVTATSIVSISNTAAGINAYTVTTDYTFTSPSATLTWVASKGPTAGSTYYVTVKYNIDAATFYQPVLCTSISDVIKNFGPDLKVDAPTTVSKLSLAAQTVLNQGAPAVWVLPVQPTTAGQAPVAADYATALDTYTAAMDGVWRIVPVDVSATINTAIDAHVIKMSSYDERAERTAVYGAAEGTAPTNITMALSSVGAVATSKANSRLMVAYPDTATMTLSDGKLYTVDAAILSAAYAGGEAVLHPQDSRTRMGLKGFATLGGFKMKKSEMLSLASCGVMILTQAATNADILVRHQLTTDMTSVQTREASIQDIADYVSRTLRTACMPYIGKFLINTETISKINGTLNTQLSMLVSEGAIISGTIVALMQDADNPDTIVVNANIQVPYPCNYINIVVALS